jgi:hypothetical protein
MVALTGFQPQVAFEDGVSGLVEWFRNGPTAVDDMLSRVEERNWGPVEVTA